MWDEEEAKAHVAKLLACKTAKERADYLTEYSEWTRLIPLFEHWSHGKCWYSEAKPRKHGAGFDMDHFRPKSSATDPWNGHRDWKGYPWLAYDWRNFRLACPNTNRPGRDVEGHGAGKGTVFPLRSPDSPIATCVAELEAEQQHVLVIDPCNAEEVCDLSFNDEGKVTCVNCNGEFYSDRVKRTVSVYNLDHAGFVEARRDVWRRGNQLVDEIAKLSRLEQLKTPSTLSELRRAKLLELATMSREDQEFAGAARAFARSRNEEWVRAASQNVEPPTYVPFRSAPQVPGGVSSASPAPPSLTASGPQDRQLRFSFAETSVVVPSPRPRRPKGAKKSTVQKAAAKATPAPMSLLGAAQEDDE